MTFQCRVHLSVAVVLHQLLGLIAIRGVGSVLRSADCERTRLHFSYENGKRMSHDEELRYVRRREGTHRSSSRETPGYERDLLRENDTENLLGPTESRPANIDEIIRSHTHGVPPRPTAAQQIAGQVAMDIMDALRPHIMHGVDVAVDTKLGIPKLVKWAKTKAEQRKAEARNQSPSTSAQLDAVPAEGTADIDDETRTLEVRKPSVTAEQYQAIQLSALRAEQYAAHMRQMLTKVAVRDGALPVEGTIRAALESPASSIDEATLRRLVELLNSSRTSDGELMLVRNQDTDAPLRAVDQPPS